MKPTFRKLDFHRLLATALILSACPTFAIRPLSTDRPDVTESPHTVDAGHFQFEMEIANWSRDEYSLAELNAKVGLDASNDLQLVLPFFTHLDDGSEGFGDIQIRLKHNLWGNDEGSTALAVMPFIKLPTAEDGLGNGEFEGGIIVPFGFEGPAGWECAVMAEVDYEAGEDERGCHFIAVTSATASHSITESTGVFIELVSAISTESSADWEAYFNTGLVYAIADLWQLDGGVRIGLTDASLDFMPFLGLSMKL
ncbi:MAG: transporter [Gloeobacteraceae cyanobacterium ES-bin-144]|nr:transporter [Verrucomicrobiales bacterium]